jgi:hypothetical protein
VFGNDPRAEALVRDSALLTLAVDQEREQRPTDADGDSHWSRPDRRIADSPDADGEELLIGTDPETDEQCRHEHNARECVPCGAARCQVVKVHVSEGYDARASGVTSVAWASVPE